MKTVLITGAAGNLGGLLADYLLDSELNLNLLIHNNEVTAKLKTAPKVKVFRADLASPDTLNSALKGVDTIVHFAGILFKHNPEKFLPTTNTVYFKNLVEKAIAHNVKRIILISFPHVEGETFPDKPAQGSFDGKPSSVHAKTRLEEEKLLFAKADAGGYEAVSLRVGMVYGRGILMIDGARIFAKLRMLGVWQQPTHIHLISTIDFLTATKNAIINDGVRGVYHLGDEGVQTLQEFLDDATKQWGYPAPKRMKVGAIMAAAKTFELFSKFLGVKSPLTQDFIKIGMASYYGDTAKARRELLPELKYKTYKDGIDTL